MAIGAPRWGGLRPDPYNPDSPDADNDGIVQEGTLFERPAGTLIVSAITGLELSWNAWQQHSGHPKHDYRGP